MRGVKNLLWYGPTVWADDDIDWTFITALLERKLRKQAQFMQSHGIVADTAQMIERLSAAADCCKRLTEDDYEDIEAGPKADVELLCEILRKHLREWWQ